jgi:hypothetical protein
MGIAIDIMGSGVVKVKRTVQLCNMSSLRP